MKKFDIELAKQGKPVCNRRGDDVRIVCFDRISENYKIIALHKRDDKEGIYSHRLDGRVTGPGEDSECDLFMKPEKRRMWVNVYREIPCSSVGCFGGLNPFATEEEAKNNIGDSKNYIATVPVEWEE